MVFGFGFNKAKVLVSAERNVKQGKLNNAIADYEKILKEDPKDLTVMNTVGDLYARVGKPEKASEYFRQVGEVYAREGFTVKAIAMYKKLTKLDPGALDAVVKLAELYTQQGLYNDARAQYLQVAEHSLRNNDLQGAARILQKTLDLDPDNLNLQGRLAELYSRLGRKNEARDLYFRYAEALRTRGAMQQADDALGHVVALDPGFTQAVLLRGMVKLDAGDAEGAARVLQNVPDIDSKPDGLRALLKAHIAKGRMDEAEPVARKLMKVFDDPSGVDAYASALMSNGSHEQALQLYREYADRLMSTNLAGLMQSLQVTIARVKTDSRALEILGELFQRAGNVAFLIEVTELLAHLCVQNGELLRARDLYRTLQELEPENPQHATDFRQVMDRLSEGPRRPEDGKAPRPLPESAVLNEVDALPALEQTHPPEEMEALNAALTEAELFESYNLPAKAVAPLESALSQVPEDARINRKLASLYARCGRLKEAAERFRVLERLYRSAGYEEDAQQFADTAAQYETTKVSTDVVSADVLEALKVPEEEQSAKKLDTVQEATTIQEHKEVDASPVLSDKEYQQAAVAEPSASAHEIDLSSEWEEVADGEIEGASQPEEEPEAASAPDSTFDQTVQPEMEIAAEAAEEEAISPAQELVDEIRFYISQAMWDEAQAAVQRCEQSFPDLPDAAELKQQVSAHFAVCDPDALETAAQNQAEAHLETAVDAPREGSLIDDALLGSEIREAQAGPFTGTEAISSGNDVLGNMVEDLEASLGNDFEVSTETVHSSPLALPTSKEAVNPSPVTESARLESSGAPSDEVSISDLLGEAEEPGNALSDIFAEFKESMESDGISQEDPETHYNLGVAFKEMGLLDEAIGELQKVCQAIDHGAKFAQAMQTYTWLADCFLHKGIPEAAVRWYEKALKSPAIDSDTAVAIHYEIACACEVAGNRNAALEHFTEVLTNNIDYRDVAERIKALRS